MQWLILQLYKKSDGLTVSIESLPIFGMTVDMQFLLFDG